MGLIAGLVTFVIGVLIGGLGIYVGAQVIVGEGGFGQAVTVAVVGSLVWGLAEAFLGTIPLVGPFLGPIFGPLLALAVYLLVVNLAYPGSWGEAAGITLVAWVTVVLVRTLLGPLGLGIVPGVGVPGI